MDSGGSVFGRASSFGRKTSDIKPEQDRSGNIFGSPRESSNVFKSSPNSIFRSDPPSVTPAENSSFLFGKRIVAPTAKSSEEKTGFPSTITSEVPSDNPFRPMGKFDPRKSSFSFKKEEGSMSEASSVAPNKNTFYPNKNASKPPPSLFKYPTVPSLFSSSTPQDVEDQETSSFLQGPNVPLFQNQSSKAPDNNPFKCDNEANNPLKPKNNPFSFKAPASGSMPPNNNNMGDQERYEGLVARNAQLRKSNEGESLGSLLIGDCPDMCPETERYRRTVQNQLRVYEKHRDGSANHKAIVKEYSRSSADQDVPLSGELRPGKVLSRTMDHILCNIVDRIDVHRGSVYDWFEYLDKNGSSNGFQPYSDVKEDIGEWFEFLWSATRAIRKDITQQRLVDLEAVDLVEKCARFHIVCTERLVEAESKDFSLKLNDENLTKCLQTLQHLYYDLDVEGISCPNESEFRSYEILMNANNGDVLRRVSTLNNDVRRSESVRFGLKVVHAINSNNYARFFKLVDESSLLQSCILLRYFNQVRSKAIETIIKAFCPNKKETQFELHKVTKMLGFEDEFESSEFLVSHGITVEGNIVLMNKPNFMFPEEAPQVRRPVNKIECKKQSDWSLIIYGEAALPPNPYIYYQPHDSFGEDGTLSRVENRDPNKDLRLAKLREKANQEKDALLQAQKRETLITRLSNDLGNGILDDITHQEYLKIGEEVITQENRLQNDSCEIYALIMAEVIHETMEDVLREARNDEINRRIKKENQSNASIELLNEYVEEFLRFMCNEIAVQEMEIVQRDLRFKHLLEESDILVQGMIEDFVDSNCRKIALEAIQEAECERDTKVMALKEIREKRLKGEFFQVWKTFVTKEKKRRKILKTFPSMPSLFQSSQSQNNKLSSCSGPLPAISLSEVIRSMKCTDNLFKYAELEDDYYNKTLLQPLDFSALIQPHLPEDGSVMKVILSSGTLDREESHDHLFFEIIKKKYSFKPSAENDLLLCRYINRKSSIVVRSLTHDNLMREVFYDDMARKRYLNGTSGIIFFVGSEENEDDIKDRMNVLLKNLPQSSGIPCVLLSNALNKNIFSCLKKMCDNERISSFKTLHFSEDPFNIETPLRILEAMKFMANNYPKDKPPLSLKSDSIRSYLDNIINDRFYKELYFDLRNRNEHRNPMIVIDFYNSLVDFVIGQVRDTRFQNLSWPVPEICYDVPVYWNDETYIDKLIEILNFVKLPKIKDPSDICNDWGEVTALVLKYFNSLVRSYSDTTPFLSEIRRILLKSYNVNSGSKLIQWANIIHTCIEYKLSLTDVSDPFDDSQGSKKELVIVFEDKSFELYVPPDSWRKLNRRESPSPSLKDSFSAQNDDASSDCYSILKDSSSTIQKEIQASNDFERKLMGALASEASLVDEASDCSSLNGMSAYNEEESFQHRQLYEREYVPMVSYLSPSLGASVSPHNVTKRLEIVMTGKSPNFSSRRIRVAEKRKLDDIMDSKENIVFSSKKQSIDRMLEDLQNQVHSSLNDSRNFEDKLHKAALQNDD